MKMYTRIAMTAATVGILASGPLAGAVSTASASTAPYPTVYPGQYTPPPSGPPIPASATPDATCTPTVAGDYAHLSGGDVSAHGWWYNEDCPNQKTTVTVGLQEYFSDRTWHNQGTGTAYVWPGGGSANRAAVHQVCDGVAQASWRSYIIITSPGGGASAYTNLQNLKCTHV
jgi:hypothetical protein